MSSLNSLTLTVGTFTAIHNETVGLVEQEPTVARVRDLEDKTVRARPHEVVGYMRRFVLADDVGLDIPESIVAIMLNERGSDLLDDELKETLPGRPLAILSFQKDGPESTLNGRSLLLDARSILTEHELVLPPRHDPLRPEYIRFAGQVGLLSVVRPKKGRPPVHELSRYLREDHGQELLTSIKRLREPQY